MLQSLAEIDMFELVAPKKGIYSDFGDCGWQMETPHIVIEGYEIVSDTGDGVFHTLLILDHIRYLDIPGDIHSGVGRAFAIPFRAADCLAGLVFLIEHTGDQELIDYMGLWDMAFISRERSRKESG